MEKRLPISGMLITYFLRKASTGGVLQCDGCCQSIALIIWLNRVVKQRRRVMIIKQNSHEDMHMIQAVIVQRTIDLKLKCIQIKTDRIFTPFDELTPPT